MHDPGRRLPLHLVREGPFRVGIGPLLPTPGDTEKAFEPFVAWLAGELDRDYDIVATSDWAGVAVALANNQIDMAWMGPWGYILAHNDSGAYPVASCKRNGKATYHAIIVGRPGLDIAQWPQDAAQYSISFADLGSTSGWLIPTAYFRASGIDPKTFFKSYRDGATHAANEMAVVSGQMDLATDYDINREVMIEQGRIPADATQVYWQSEELPLEAIAFPRDFDRETAMRIQRILLDLPTERARAMLPLGFDGFVPATHETFSAIEEAGILVGRIKPRA